MHALDASVIVAALDGQDPDHAASRQLLLSARFSIHPHALSETFSTLTGGRLAIRIPAADAASILRENVAPRLAIIELSAGDLLGTYDDSTRRGIRGGAIYDYLHLASARKAGAPKLYSLNTSDFLAFHRPGDPEIAHP